MSKEELPEYLKPAYDIFIQELGQHLDEMNEICPDSLQDPECRAEISRRMHTIKGGAGFLGLKDIATHADKAEKIFKEEASLEHYQKTLVEILGSLKKQAKDL